MNRVSKCSNVVCRIVKIEDLEDYYTYKMSDNIPLKKSAMHALHRDIDMQP